MANDNDTGADAPDQTTKDTSTPDRAQLEEMLRESFKGRPVEDVWRDIRQIYLDRIIARASINDETNPFICKDDYQPLQATVFRVHQSLTIFDRALDVQPDSTGNLMVVLDCNEASGLQLVLQGLRDALLNVAERLTGLECFDEDDTALCKDFARLSEAQQETIAYLIKNILDGDVSPVNVATKDAARISLARFEAAADTLLVDKCAEELARYGVEVALDMTPEHPDDYDPYTVTKNLTFKGLRLELARERFFESVTCNMEVES